MSARLQSVNLTNEEEDHIIINVADRGSALKECLLSLLDRFLTQKPINLHAAKSEEDDTKLQSFIFVIDKRYVASVV